jgi:hypothetical protein
MLMVQQVFKEMVFRGKNCKKKLLSDINTSVQALSGSVESWWLHRDYPIIELPICVSKLWPRHSIPVLFVYVRVRN